MYHTTAKLIALDRAEALLASGWPKGSPRVVWSVCQSKRCATFTTRGEQTVLARQAKALRQEIPPHIVAAYGQLKAEHKEAVVGVFEEKCGGCHAPRSKTALARLSAETEIGRCEHCGRFIYLAGGHSLASSGHSHHFTGGHSRR